MHRQPRPPRPTHLLAGALVLSLAGLWSPTVLANNGKEYVTGLGGAPACKRDRFEHNSTSPSLRILGIPGLATPVQLWGDGMDFAESKRTQVEGALRGRLDVDFRKSHGGAGNVIRGCDGMGSLEVSLSPQQLVDEDRRGSVKLRFPLEPSGPYVLPITLRPLVRGADWEVASAITGCLGGLGGSLLGDADGNLAAALPATLLGSLGGCLPEATLKLQLPTGNYVDFLPAGIDRLSDLALQTRLANTADAGLVEILSADSASPRLRFKAEGLRSLLPTLTTVRTIPIQIRAEGKLVGNLTLKLSKAVPRFGSLPVERVGGLLGGLTGGTGGGDGNPVVEALPDLVPELDGLLLRPDANGLIDGALCQALKIPLRSNLGAIGTLLGALLSQTPPVTLPALGYSVRNAGAAAAATSSVQGFGSRPTATVPALAPGESARFEARPQQSAKLLNLTAAVASQLGLGNRAGCYLPAGQEVDTDPASLTVVADPANRVRESNETNNRLSR